MDASSGKYSLDHSWEKRGSSRYKGGRKKQERAQVIAMPEGVTKIPDLEATSAELVPRAISTFFNEMMFELDGTWLTFKGHDGNAKGSVAHFDDATEYYGLEIPSKELAF